MPEGTRRASDVHVATARAADNRRCLDVAHPEFLGHTPTGRRVMIARPDESFEVIDLLLVTGLEPIDGKPRSRRQRKKPGGPGR